MVFRIFVEKKPGLDPEAQALLNDARELLGITGLERVRLLKRYDVENIGEELFDYAVKTVFSEPQLDRVYDAPELQGASVFAVEYLPGRRPVHPDPLPGGQAAGAFGKRVRAVRQAHRDGARGG